MLDQIKKALRISHTLLDDDITNTIEIACAECVRAGIPIEIMTNYNDPLVASLIKTYCLYYYADRSDADRYFTSFQYQLDNVRKSHTYLEGVE